MGKMKEIARQRQESKGTDDMVLSAMNTLKECRDLILERVALVENSDWPLMQSCDKSIEEMEAYLGTDYRGIAKRTHY